MNNLDASILAKNLIRAIQKNNSKQALDILQQVSFPKGSYYLYMAIAKSTGKGNYLVSVALIEAGSDVNGVNDNIPLINTVLSRQYDLARYLLESGADTECKDENSYTVLMHAVSNQDLEAVILLIEAGASCKTETYDGVTAKDIAERQNLSSILQYLSSRSTNN